MATINKPNRSFLSAASFCGQLRSVALFLYQTPMGFRLHHAYFLGKWTKLARPYRLELSIEYSLRAILFAVFCSIPFFSQWKRKFALEPFLSFFPGVKTGTRNRGRKRAVTCPVDFVRKIDNWRSN